MGSDTERVPALGVVMAEEWLTAKEVGERLRVHQKTVKKWALRGRIPCARASKKTLRFPWQEVCRALGKGTACG